MSQTTSVKFKAKYARRLPDPNDEEKEHYIFWVNVHDMPKNIPKEPNPREQNTNLMVYREVKMSLLNDSEFTPDTFHLKNQGMDLIATEVKRVKKKANVYKVIFEEEEGILNGAHTYKIIMENRDELESENQYVPVRITTNIDLDFIAEMAGGLNSSVQVDKEALLNQQGEFNWIKEILEDESYSSQIAYTQHEKKPMVIRELISIMTIFNIDLYPVDEKSPTVAFSSKKACLDKYDDNKDSYKKLEPILKDIFELHDKIRYESIDYHKEENQGNPSKLNFVDKRKQKPYKFIFIGERRKHRLSKGVLYPLLGAFRPFIEEDEENNKFHWKVEKGFEEIKGIWDEYAADLIKEAHNASKEMERNPARMGKSQNVWSLLKSKLLSSYLSASF